jgi:hypothetical protein
MSWRLNHYVFGRLRFHFQKDAYDKTIYSAFLIPKLMHFQGAIPFLRTKKGLRSIDLLLLRD